MSDPFAAAVTLWWDGNRTSWKFAEAAAKVDGLETLKLANACNVSPDVIENRRSAFRLFYDINRDIEPAEAHRIREETNLSIWTTAARYRTSYPLPDLWDKIKIAHEHGMTVRQFAAHLDNATGDVPEWGKGLRRVVRMAASLRRELRKLTTDYKGVAMPAEIQKRIVDAVKAHEAATEAFESEMRAIAEEG